MEAYKFIRRFKLTALFLLFCGLVLGLHQQAYMDIFPQLNLISSEANKPHSGSAFNLTVNEIIGEMLPRILPFACLRSGPFSSLQFKLIMCIKRLEVDMYISKSIHDTGAWEKSEIDLILKLLSIYPEATFLDVGSNIGAFSVAAAAANYKVIAVDPLQTNLAYQRLSTLLQGTEDNIRFIANSVSGGEKFTLYPWNRYPDNEGAMTFLTEEEAKNKPKSQVGDGVESVSFQDLMDTVQTDTVVVKIDIEGHECKALIPYLQKQIKSKFVPYILMEWIIIKDNRDGMCPDVQLLIQGFIDSGYYPADLVSMNKLNVLQQTSWNNVLWIHNDAKH